MTLREAISNRPAVGVALAAAAGSGLAAAGTPPWAAAAAIAAACLIAVAATFFLGRRRRFDFAVAAAFPVCLAFFAWGSHLAAQRGRTIADIFGDSASASLELCGVVGSDIDSSPLRNGGTRLEFSLCDINPGADGESSVQAALARHGAPQVRVVWFGHRPSPDDPRPVPSPGERWRFRGKATLFGRNPARPGIELSSGNDRSARLEPAARGSVRAAVAAMRAECSRRLSLGMEGHKDESAMAQAILLGYRHDIPYRLNRIFRNSGTMHVFAISGMHVMIVAGFLTFLLGPLGVPRTKWFMVVCPILVAYTVATGAQPSAVRACLMTCLYFAAPLFGRRPDGASALALAAIALLAWDPSQIANAGFLLSFTVVAGLIALAAPLAALFRRFKFAIRLRDDEHALWKLGGEVDSFSLWRARAALAAYRYLADLTAVSIVAWIASAPLTAWYFNRLSPAAILANLVIVPLALVVVVAGCTGLVAASASAFLASAINKLVVAATATMASVAKLASASPMLTCKVPRPPAWLIAVWYLSFALLAWRLHARAAAEDDTLPY